MANELDITTDRDLADATDNKGFWKPLNQGPDDSWGVLLNENFDAIDELFVAFDQLILGVINSNTAIEAKIGIERARITSNLLRIDSLSTQVTTQGDRITDVETILTDAAGIYSSVGDRISQLISISGEIQTQNILDDVHRLEWREYETSVAQESYVQITNLFSTGGQVVSDGTTEGVITQAGVSADYSYGMVFTDDGRPVYAENGERVIVSLSSVSSNLRLSFRTTSGNTYIFNQPGNLFQVSDIKILYPAIVDAYNLSDLSSHMLLHDVPGPATSGEFGVVRLGSGNGIDADTVDGIHASETPVAGYLLPLDISGEFPFEYIGIHNDGLDTNLKDVYPSLLHSEFGDENKSITDYIGNSGGEFFIRAKAGNEGQQFTKTRAQIEDGIDDNATAISTNISNIADNASDISDLESELTTLENTVSGDLVDITAHKANPDAHHSSTSDGLDITPNSINASSGTIEELTVNNLVINELISSFQDATIQDRFIDLNYPLLSGEIPEFGSAEIPITDEYKAGFVFHKGMTYASGEYVVVRYNDTAERMEIAANWQPELLTPTDTNLFKLFGGSGGFTAVVDESGQGDYDNITDALAAVSAGKIAIKDGVYTENITLDGDISIEGMGKNTVINGSITIDGDWNTVQDITCGDITLNAAVEANRILHNNVSGEITDNSGVTANTLFDNFTI